MRREVVIWGAGGHAEVVADIVRVAGHLRLIGFLDAVDPNRSGEVFAGSTVLGGLEQLAALAAREVLLLPGVGDCAARLHLLELAGQHGLELASAIHPSAILAAGVALGAGSVVAAHVVVNPGATIGRGVILNTASSVDHHCTLADGVHLSPGARLAGRVQVGRGAWIGLGALVCDHLAIGEGAIVGAGAVVIREVLAGTVVVGNPARFLKSHPLATHSS